MYPGTFRPCFSINFLLAFSINCAFLISNEAILSEADFPKVTAAVLSGKDLEEAPEEEEEEGDGEAVVAPIAPFEPWGDVRGEEEDDDDDEEGDCLSAEDAAGTPEGMVTGARGGSGGSCTGSGTLPSRKLVMVMSTFWVCTVESRLHYKGPKAR